MTGAGRHPVNRVDRRRPTLAQAADREPQRAGEADELGRVDLVGDEDPQPVLNGWW